MGRIYRKGMNERVGDGKLIEISIITVAVVKLPTRLGNKLTNTFKTRVISQSRESDDATNDRLRTF